MNPLSTPRHGRQLLAVGGLAAALVAGGGAAALASGSPSPGATSSGSASASSGTATPPTPKPGTPHLDGTVTSVNGSTIRIKDPQGFTRTIKTSSATTYTNGLTATPTTGTRIHATGTVDANGTDLDATTIGTPPAPHPAGPGKGRPHSGPNPPAPANPSSPPSTNRTAPSSPPLPQQHPHQPAPNHPHGGGGV